MKFNYMLLGRLKSDCEYFLNYGGRSIKHLYYDSVEEHISEMKRMWNNFPLDKKPEWLTFGDIEKYEKEMLNNN